MQTGGQSILEGADDATLGRLVDEHYGAMHRFARLVGRDSDNTAAAVRAAWLAALEHPESQPAETTLRGWLLTLVLDAIAAPEPPAGAQPVAPPDDFEDPNGRWAGWWKDDLRATPALDDDRLERALCAIPAGLAAILILRDVEGLAPTEIEALLGHPAVRQLHLLHYARVAMRNALRGKDHA